MRARLIINPISGDAEPNTLKIDLIHQSLAGADFIPETIPTSLEKTAADIAKEAVREGIEIVLVGGGDGTVGEVARELINTDTTLGIIPIGTFNNVARSLDIPAEIEAACQIIAQNHTRKIDIGFANDTYPFLEAAGAGLDATLFPLGEEIKGGQWTRLWQFCANVFQYQAPRFRLTFEHTVGEALPSGKTRRYSTRALRRRFLTRRALFVVVANGPYYGSGFTVAPNASLNDGKFTISIYRGFSKWELFRHFQSIYGGKRHYSSKIETFVASEVRIETRRPIPVHLDGQPFLDTPVRLSTLPAALRVFVPKKVET